MTDVALTRDTATRPTQPTRLGPAPTAPTSARDPRRRPAAAVRMPRIVVLLWVALVAYLIDVVTKFLVVASLNEDDPVRVLAAEQDISRPLIDAALRYRDAYPDEVEARIALHRHDTGAADAG